MDSSGRDAPPLGNGAHAVSADQGLFFGVSRDAVMEGIEEATRLHRDRYHAAEMIYLAEVRPRSLADVVIDNRDFANPRILGYRRG